MTVVTRDEAVGNAKSGTLIGTIVAEYNTLAAAMNTLLAKLDADAGITDTDYASTVGTQDTIAYRNSTTPTS